MAKSLTLPTKRTTTHPSRDGATGGCTRAGCSGRAARFGSQPRDHIEFQLIVLALK
jgi:hypothetical protein